MAYAERRNSYTARSTRSYADVGLETAVLNASPTRLVTLLFTGARAAIAKAKIHMEAGQIPERGKAISHATRIVDEGLKQSLNLSAGGEVAENLSRLYNYIIRSLYLANYKADIEQLNVADRLLAELQTAWQQAADPQPQAIDESQSDQAQP
ncbi:MAG TPA: flagellar export chaperone FliS [Bordetella sp.]|uniref:flagellar export chaperone FliS n=1 Tax=Bordetella sp. TaxID=28081 RepID=UPI002ED29AC0